MQHIHSTELERARAYLCATHLGSYLLSEQHAFSKNFAFPSDAASAFSMAVDEILTATNAHHTYLRYGLGLILQS